MPKPQKLEAVSELKERLERADAALLTEYRGLKVQEMKELRRTLAESGTDLKVVKNTLTRIAAKQAKLEELLPLLEGSTAIAFIQGDPVAAAKGIDDMAKKYPALVVKGGVLDGKVFGPEQAQALAKVKPREVLLTQLAGMMQAPLQSLANLLTAPLRELGYVLGAYRAKLEQEAPAEDAAPPPPVAEAAEPSAEAPAATEASETETAEPAAETETTPETEPTADTQTAEPADEAEAASEPPAAAAAETTSDSEPAAEPEPAPAASEAVEDTSDVMSDATDAAPVSDPLPDEGAEGVASPSQDDNIENKKEEE